MKRLATVCVMAIALACAAALPAAASPATDVAAAATPLRVMPLGDSITWGIGSSTGNGYRSFLSDRLVSSGHSVDLVGSGRDGTMADPDHEGHSGLRIDQIASLVDSVMARYRPNVVTLEIGTNDLGQQYQVPTAPDRLRSLVDQITRAAPDATIVLGSVIISTSSTEEPLRGPFNAAIPGIVQSAQAAGKHVQYADMGALNVGDLSDALHPNDSGYRKMADAFNAGIQAADAAGWIRPPVDVGVPVQSGIAGKCLDVNTGSSVNGTAVQIWGCNRTTAQFWNALPNGTLQALGKCLDAVGTANGSRLGIWDCNGGSNQQWQTYNGGYRNPASGRCLDVPGSSTTDGTQVVLWDCNGGANQRWTRVIA